MQLDDNADGSLDFSESDEVSNYYCLTIVHGFRPKREGFSQLSLRVGKLGVLTCSLYCKQKTAEWPTFHSFVVPFSRMKSI